MDANTKYELYLIKTELKKIIGDLYYISDCINRDFEGIGNEKCSNRIQKIAYQYETIEKKLNEMELFE